MKTMPRLKRFIPAIALVSMCAFSSNTFAAVTSVASGAWNNPATWDTGVPVAADDVVIGAGTTVTINTTPLTVTSLTVNGTLEYDATARSLTVSTHLSISPGGTLQTNPVGAQVNHALLVGGNLTNDGTLDLSTSGNTAGGRLTFTGAASNTFSGTGPTTDLRTLTINKGTSQANILEITTPFSVQGTVVDGTPMAFLTLTNGTLKISGTFAFAGRTSAGGLSIPANGGFWLNNPNYTVSAQAGNGTVNGLLRVSQGTLNVGTAANNSLSFGNNAVVTVEGGAINVAGRFGVNGALNNLAYTQTGGVITVCTVSQNSTTLASFDLGQGLGPDVVMSGGTVILRNANTGVPARDYRNQQGNTALGISNTLVQFGDAGSGPAKTFNVEGLLPNVVVSNASAGHTLLFRPPTAFSNSARDVTIDAGCTFNIGNNTYLQRGSTFTNNGTLTATGPWSRFVWHPAGGNGTYQGFGTSTGVLTSWETQMANLTMSQASPLVARRIVIFDGNIQNASTLTLGDGSATPSAVQIGNMTTPTAAGSFDVAPTLNLGTGGQSIHYLRTTVSRSTGIEVDPGRALVDLTYDDNDPSHTLTIAGGDLAVSGTTALTNGRVVTNANTLAANGAVTRTAGYVDGLLQKPVAVGGPVTRTFEVGDAVAYSPVDVTFASVMDAGTLTGKANGGEHAEIGSSGINAAKSVNRNWTLTNSGTTFTTADAVFNFAPGDVDGGADFNDFVVRKYDAPSWSALTTGTRTATSTQATGITSFSDFAVGALVTFAIDASSGPGGAIAPLGSVTVPIGSDQSFTITPIPGFSIADVVVDGSSVGAVGSYTFPNVTADHTIHATFVANIYTISATSGPNGAIAPSDAVSVSGTSDQAFTITPAVGYHIADVLVDGSSVGAVGTYTFTNVIADHTIHATFEINVYTITATAGANGSIAPSGAVGVNHGSDQAFTITPDVGHHIVDVLVDGSSVGPVDNYTFTNVTTEHTIDATFAINVYSITASAGPNGTIAPSGAIGVNHGSDQAFTITPSVGYHVEDVLVDGSSVGAVGNYTFTNVTTEHTIHAAFAINVYTITATAGTGGTIAPSGAVGVNHGSDQAFTITPDANYHIADVVVDGSSVGAVAAYTFTNVTTGHTIHASFCLSNVTFDLNPSSLNLNSHGKWVTAILEPAAPYAPADINVSSLLLQGSIAVDTEGPVSIGDADEDGIADLAVKFPRADVAELLSVGNQVEVSIAGSIGSECFASTDVIKVKSKTLQAPTASVLAPGSQVDVEWEGDGEYNKVDLIASYDNGQTWSIEARDINNNGRYRWTVPGVYTTQARVAVVKLASSATSGDVMTVAEMGESGYAIHSTTGVGNEDIAFALKPVQPNPAKGAFNVSFSLPTSKPATLAVYDISGREVASRTVAAAGRHTMNFGARERLRPGVYLVKITHENRSLKGRVVVIE